MVPVSSRDENHQPPLYTLETAPDDDEPETAEEEEAVRIAWREHADGLGLTTEELKAEPWALKTWRADV